ncbi:uncharacterized protein BDZ99DRAFT_62698 [Mytilinidion resinicola]|uniref:Uncharacterized protein n=1 Tax=Mytilinidion resinicola TaxID=574789 RepID=A0A6A6YGI6_9PEZI|nr:uncharacterized protein BDZ99DRAFT_62698 [Mytilinidion resinicola]KAF2807688.1 hypothetical protein BDZ99DRAFT_62698 [Mytilinidion resinicola]
MSWGFQPNRGMLNLGNNPHLITPEDFPPSMPPEAYFGAPALPFPMPAAPMAFGPPLAIGIAGPPLTFAPPPATFGMPVPMPIQLGGPPPMMAPPPMQFGPPMPQPPHGGHIPPAWVANNLGGPPATIPNMPNEGSNLHFPGGRQPGYNILFSKEYCSIHVFVMDNPPWADDANTNQAEVQKFHADCNWNVKQLMEALRPGQDCSAWAITEVVEKGDGKWARGSTFVYTSERAGFPLTVVGWTKNRRDGDKGAVWVWMHKP